MRSITMILAMTLLAATGFGGTVSIIASFQIPSQYALGIDYYAQPSRPGYLYIGDGEAHGRIYEYTVNGAMVRSIYNVYGARGCARTNVEFWTSDNAGYIYRLSTEGSFIRSFAAPGAVSELDYDAGFLWCTSGGSRVNKLTIDGSVIASFGFSSACGISSDNGYLWVTRTNASPNLFQLTPTGSTVDSFQLIGLAYGLTWEGSYLWYSTGTARIIYKAKLGYTNVEPASLGKVKAIYR